MQANTLSNSWRSKQSVGDKLNIFHVCVCAIATTSIQQYVGNCVPYNVFIYNSNSLCTCIESTCMRSWGQTRYPTADMVNNQQVISFLTCTFLPQNHMIIHCLQTWSYPAEVCNKTSDWWLAIHICATHLVSAVTTLFITRRTGLAGYCLCIQVGPFGPCDKSRIILIACLFTPVFSVRSFHYILLFWRYFICKTGKGVRKVPSHS